MDGFSLVDEILAVGKHVRSVFVGGDVVVSDGRYCYGDRPYIMNSQSIR